MRELSQLGVVTPISPLIEFDSEREIWERQPEEIDSAWAVFQAYRDLPPSDRTVAAAVAATGAEAGPHMVYYHGWARRYRWRERTIAYDVHYDKIMTEALQGERIRARVDMLSLGRALQQKAMEAAGVLRATLYDGDNLRSALGANAIATLARVGSQLTSSALELDQPGARYSMQLNVNITSTAQSDQLLLGQAKEVLKIRAAQEEVVEGEYSVDQGASGSRAVDPD